jgi:hypothetical protein
MALKPHRVERYTDISFFFPSGTAERGIIVTFHNGGSGEAMDQALAKVRKPLAEMSGARPAGLLMNDVVNIDQTRQHINFHKDEVQVGSKVCLLIEGEVTTNMVSGTPTAGQKAYFNSDGQLSATRVVFGDGTSEVPQVGVFLSAKDSDGYAKVRINMHGN